MRLAVGGVVAALLLAACTSAVHPTTVERPLVARADATIVIAMTRSGDRIVALAIDRLPPPERLGLDLWMYAVWIVPPGRAPIRAGRLDYDREDGHGELTLVTPYEGFRLLVTAEPGLSTTRPSPVVVVDRSVSG